MEHLIEIVNFLEHNIINVYSIATYIYPCCTIFGVMTHEISDVVKCVWLARASKDIRYNLLHLPECGKIFHLCTIFLLAFGLCIIANVYVAIATYFVSATYLASFHLFFH